MTDPVETLARALWLHRCNSARAWDESPTCAAWKVGYIDRATALLAQIGPAIVAEAVAKEKARIVQIIHEHCGTWHGEPVYLDLVEDDLDQFFAAIRARSET